MKKVKVKGDSVQKLERKQTDRRTERSDWIYLPYANAVGYNYKLKIDTRYIYATVTVETRR